MAYLTLKKSAILMSLMLSASVLAMVLKPEAGVRQNGARPNYEAAIPKSFSTWTMVNDAAVTVADPQQQEVLDEIYSQLVTRSYRDAVTGQVVMLAVAYGEKQTKQSQVHLPEICYPAQGFAITASTTGVMELDKATIPVKQILAVKGSRTEPVTYWIRVGDKIVRGGIDQKLAAVTEGLSGRIADGMLFRISTISNDPAAAQQLQKRFTSDLLASVPPDTQRILIGRSTQATPD